MKRFRVLANSVLAALAIFTAIHAFAETRLSVGSEPGFPAVPVTLPLLLNNATNVVAAQFDLSYNPTRVIAGDVLLAQSLSNHVMRTYDLSTGVRRVLIYSRSGAAITNRQLAEATFTVVPEERSSSGAILPASAVVAHDDASPVAPLTINAGSVFVTPVHLGLDGSADLFLRVTNDQRYVIHASTNLEQWLPIATNAPVGDYLQLNDPQAINFPQRFYKAVAE